MNPNFTKSADGLIPAVIQDASTNVVLMLGYMNNEAFEKTKNEKRVTFFCVQKIDSGQKGKKAVIF